MDFAIPEKTQKLLTELDAFIEEVIKPIEQEDDNIRFFDHRREDSRTDWDRNGLPNADWENLLKRMRQEADKAGFGDINYRHASVVKMETILTWQLFGSIWPEKD